MRILTVNPKTPPTFWDFTGALEFIGKNSSEPPLGLLTVAALLPPDWEIRLIDLNVSHLSHAGFEWADFLLLGGRMVQRSSFLEVVRRCRSLCTAVVARGPPITTEHDTLDCVDHLVIGEEVSIIPELMCDALAGRVRPVYAVEYPDLRESPVPRWDLLDSDAYATLSLQSSRSCPFDRECKTSVKPDIFRGKAETRIVH